MSTLLHLDSSANRCGESVSRELTALFADTWRTQHGSAGYRYRDLVANPVLAVDTAYCALGRRVERHGLVGLGDVSTLAQSPEERQAWTATHPLITEVLAADTVLIGAPMYNYSVPAALKTWIDRVSFPGAFRDQDTGGSLLRNTRVVVITARGGAGDSRDFHIPYLRAYFAQQGVAEANIRFVTVEWTLATLVPRLREFRPLARRCLDGARAEVAALATSAI